VHEVCWDRAQKLEHEQDYLQALPSAEMYEKSYMHRDIVTQAAVAADVHFIITGSADGHIKFWKKRAQGVEFAKHFRAHLGPVRGGRIPDGWQGQLLLLPLPLLLCGGHALFGGPEPVDVGLVGLSVSHDGSLLASWSDDKSIKIFDIANLDMIAMLRLPYIPACAEWAFKVSSPTGCEMSLQQQSALSCIARQRSLDEEIAMRN
jgi:peptidylprolyl isomerase domain and WD repeat-containing protein 1